MNAHDLHRDMPLLTRQQGVWEGIYRHYDAAGHKIDEHAVRMVCRLPADGPYAWHQTNHYTWPDGRTEVRDFLATWRDGRLWFENDLIRGWAAEVPLDEQHRTMMLHWIRRDDPDTCLYEMIQTSDDGRYRTRVWQWLRAGRIFRRTLIDEHRLSPDPNARDAPSDASGALEGDELV